AQADEFDVIVLDRMLPGGLDGIEICEKLRAEGNKTPIIMLTAKTQVRDKVAGLNAGADDYLIKPFAFEELLARIGVQFRILYMYDEIKKFLNTQESLSKQLLDLLEESPYQDNLPLSRLLYGALL
ncbi:MAG TPA: response regulator, partial [Spirochaetota bacterium]|nr:response regulator [Spirochaetota bacterium]